MALTREQKQAVVSALMSQAGNLAEFWSELVPDVPVHEGVEYLASLMRRMPGTVWDTRLGEPDKK